MFMGMVMVFSASSMFGEGRFGSLTYFFRKQIIWGAIAFLLMMAISRFDYRRLRQSNIPLILIVVSVALLAGLFVLGVRVNGARRWYHLGIMNFQPSELAKFSLIIFSAAYLSQKGQAIRDLKRGILPYLAVLVSVVVPVMLQPDLSTSLMIAAIGGLLLFISPARLKHLLGIALGAVPVAIFFGTRHSYQRGRISDWLHALGDPLSATYQIRQSLIGLGRGGLFGQGLAHSKQKFLFLPDSHTDFIFSILGEELGFIGTTVILIVFLFILYRGLRIAHKTDDPFAKYLSIGITLNMVMYALINAAVVSMLVPATGLPMPFISYGGSHLLFLGMSMGLLLNISRSVNPLPTKARWEDFKDKRERFYRTIISAE